MFSAARQYASRDSTLACATTLLAARRSSISGRQSVNASSSTPPTTITPATTPPSRVRRVATAHRTTAASPTSAPRESVPNSAPTSSAEHSHQSTRRRRSRTDRKTANGSTEASTYAKSLASPIGPDTRCTSPLMKLSVPYSAAAVAEMTSTRSATSELRARAHQLHEQERERAEEQVAQRLGQARLDVAREHQRQQHEHHERDQRRQRRRQAHVLVAADRAQEVPDQQQRAEQLRDRHGLAREPEHVVPRERGQQQQQQPAGVEDDEAEHDRRRRGRHREQRGERGRYRHRQRDQDDPGPLGAANPDARGHFTKALVDSGLV